MLHIFSLLVVIIPIINGFHTFYKSNYFRSSHSNKKDIRFHKIQASIGLKDVDNLTLRILSSIEDIDRNEWNNLLAHNSSPFLQYDWLYCLENSGCASTDEGWQPVHILLQQNVTNKTELSENKDCGVTIVAACPLYLKYHRYKII